MKNIKKQREKYPSLSQKVIEQSGIILEILDARFISRTRNIDFEEMIKKKGKKIIYVLNKADLIEKEKTNSEELEKIIPYEFVSCKKREGIKKLRDRIKAEAKKINSSDRITVGVIGYPNTGKSSVINLLSGKSSAGTGADAGFTKGIQKIKLAKNIILMDTPGVIPEKEYSNVKKELITKHTIVGGRSYSQVKEPEMIVAGIMVEFPGILEKYYKIDEEGDSEKLIKEIGSKKGFLKKGGVVDEDKSSRFILKEWQEGKIKAYDL